MGDSFGFSRQSLFLYPCTAKKDEPSGLSFQRIKKASQSLPPAGACCRKNPKGFSTV